MPSSSSWRTARRCAAARWTLASRTGSSARDFSGWTDMVIAMIARSVRPDGKLLDQASIFLVVVAVEPGELLGTPARHLEALRREAFLHRRQGQHLRRGGVQPPHH